MLHYTGMESVEGGVGQFSVEWGLGVWLSSVEWGDGWVEYGEEGGGGYCAFPTAWVGGWDSMTWGNHSHAELNWAELNFREAHVFDLSACPAVSLPCLPWEWLGS